MKFIRFSWWKHWGTLRCELCVSAQGQLFITLCNAELNALHTHGGFGASDVYGMCSKWRLWSHMPATARVSEYVCIIVRICSRLSIQMFVSLKWFASVRKSHRILPAHSVWLWCLIALLWHMLILPLMTHCKEMKWVFQTSSIL